MSIYDDKRIARDVAIDYLAEERGVTGLDIDVRSLGESAFDRDVIVNYFDHVSRTTGVLWIPLRWYCERAWKIAKQRGRIAA